MGHLFKLRGFLPYVAMLFLNAFVDLGHKIVIQNTVFKVYDGQTQIVLMAIVNALILLPFIMLFTPAGYIGDKYPKPRVMRVSAWVAVGLTILITLFYYQGWFWPAFAMTFLLAMQSAFYSPAKYGYIRELVGKNSLAAANGIVQAATTVAILSGIFVFSMIFEFLLADKSITTRALVLTDIAPIGYFLILGALVEVAMAYRLPQTQETDTSMHFDWRKYRRATYIRENLATVTRHETILLSIIGLSIFWSISQVMIAAFPAYAEVALNETNTVVIQGILACTGFGIVVGSVIAGRVSRGHIETGLIPIGSFGVAMGVMLVPMLNNVTALASVFFSLGIFGGFFIIPLNALIQFHAREESIGVILAGNNFIQNVVMLSFLSLTVAVTAYGLEVEQLLRALVIVAVIGAVYTLYRLPQAMARFVVTAVIARAYRLEVLGFKNIPESGGVLMLGNHISWMDWAIVQMACPRPLRFVMEHGIYNRWYLRPFMDFFGVIPISRGSSREAIALVTDALNAGDVVCLFPEGTISRTGQLSEFKRGYQRAAENAEGVILPFYLHGLWGSVFSSSSAQLKMLRRGGVKRDLIVAFGKPLAMKTLAPELKQKISELSIDSWQRYTDTLPTLPEAFIDTAKRMGGRRWIVDQIAGELSARRVLTGAVLFSRKIGRLSQAQNVGFLVPTSAGGALANMAALMRGKTIVNLNYTASPDAIRAAIKKADIRTIFTSERFLKKLEQRSIDLSGAFDGVDVHYLEEISASISPLTRLTALALCSLLPAAWLRGLYCRKVSLESPAAILFSSGSEGEPKGIMLSHRNVMANIKQISDVLNVQDNDCMMNSLPLFHAFGLTATTLMPLVEGMPMICHPDPTDVVNAAKAIARHQATIFCATSTFLRLYTKNRRVNPLMLQSLRIVVAGAEKLAPDVREGFKQKFGRDVLEGYGATETTPIASVNLPDQLDTRYWRVQQGGKPGSVGLALPGSSFRIVDPDTLAELPADEDGLILIGGTQVMLGYLKDPDKTAEVIAELDGLRWYKTGDKGHVDKDGFLSIADLYSRFAKLGGEMVSLSAVENLVRDCIASPELDLVAVNIPDEKKGEKIVLLIERSADLDAEALRRAMLDNAANPLMIPAEVLAIDEVPKLGSGNTDFKAARAMVSASVDP